MKRKKIYISGGITGISEEVYKKRFQDAEDQLIKEGYDVVNPFKIPAIVDNPKWEDYMKQDLIEMMKCDEVFALENWQLSRGARVEVNIAVTLKIFIRYQNVEVSVNKYISEISKGNNNEELFKGTMKELLNLL